MQTLHTLPPFVVISGALILSAIITLTLTRLLSRYGRRIYARFL